MKRVAVPQTLQSRTINVRAGGGTCAMSSVQGKKEDEREGGRKKVGRRSKFLKVDVVNDDQSE